jgi:hypothetical protein
VEKWQGRESDKPWDTLAERVCQEKGRKSLVYPTNTLREHSSFKQHIKHLYSGIGETGKEAGVTLSSTAC